MRTENRHRGVLRTLLWGATIVLVVWILADLAGRYLELGAPGSVPSSMPSTMLALGSLLVALVALGASGAHLGGAPTGRAAIRVFVGGVLALAISLGIGPLTGSVV